jgi:hypothetical protein
LPFGKVYDGSRLETDSAPKRGRSAKPTLGHLPDDKLGGMLPHRPRSYAQLVYPIFNIADAFLEHKVQGLPLKEGAYGWVLPPEGSTKAKILAYGQEMLARFEAWWGGSGQSTDFSHNANVYYGDVTLHEYLERTPLDSGQHLR